MARHRKAREFACRFSSYRQFQRLTYQVVAGLSSQHPCSLSLLIYGGCSVRSLHAHSRVKPSVYSFVWEFLKAIGRRNVFKPLPDH